MTPKERATMQQALEALENAYENGFLTGITGLKTIDIITALREAQAGDNMSPTEQAEQEPVAWQFFEDGKWWIGSEYNHHRQLTEEAGYPIRELYAAPVRTKDLTPNEITALIREGAAGGGWQGFAQRVIAADREKNK